MRHPTSWLHPNTYTLLCHSLTVMCLGWQAMAEADKERVAKLKAVMPPVPKPAKGAAAKGSPADAAKDKPAAKAPRAKTAYLVSLQVPDLYCCLEQAVETTR